MILISLHHRHQCGDGGGGGGTIICCCEEGRWRKRTRDDRVRVQWGTSRDIYITIKVDNVERGWYNNQIKDSKRTRIIARMRDDKDINVGRRNMTASRTMEYTTINLTRTRSIARRTRDDEDTNRLMQQKQARAQWQMIMTTIMGHWGWRTRWLEAYLTRERSKT